MEFLERESGLVVPKDKSEKPKPPPRNYGPTELRTEDRRKMAEEALSKLWDAMNLSNPGGGIKHIENENHDLYYQVYRFVGEMLLGRDCPEKEMKC